MPITITSNGGGDTASISIDEGNAGVTTVVTDRPSAIHSIVQELDHADFTIDTATGALTFIGSGTAPRQVTVKVLDPLTGNADTQTVAVTINAATGLPAQSGSANYAALLAAADAVWDTRESWPANKKNIPCEHPNGAGLLTVVDGYNRFNVSNAFVRAYEGTGDAKYLGTLVTYADEHIAVAYDYDADGWLDWGTCPGYRTPPYNHDHYEWRAACPLAFALLAFHKYPNLTLATAARKQQYAEFLRDEVWAKWQPGNIPNASNTGTIGTTNIGRLGIIAMALDKYYGPTDTTWATYLSTKAKSVADELTANPIDGGLGGNFRTRNDNTDTSENTSLGSVGTIDVSHNTDNVMMLIWAYELGYSWMPQSLLDKMVYTFLNKVWQPNGIYRFNRNWDGSSGTWDDNTANQAAHYVELVKYSDGTKRAAIEAWALDPANLDGTNSYAMNANERFGLFAKLLN